MPRLPRSSAVKPARRPQPALPPFTLPASLTLLTKSQVCQLAKCSPKFLEKETKDGHLRVHRLSPKLVRFRPIDIENWLASKAV
jgi:hypothetical protein